MMSKQTLSVSDANRMSIAACNAPEMSALMVLSPALSLQPTLPILLTWPMEIFKRTSQNPVLLASCSLDGSDGSHT
jgi:hypothetical protein